MHITKKERDYMVQIGQSTDKFPMRLSELARSLGVSEPTAFEMIERLKKAGLVETKTGMIVLTKNGHEFYRKIIMAHRTLETLLFRFGIEPDLACKECSKIDYLVDQEVIIKLFGKLNAPELCPHGKLINVT
ncbi:MAG: metal-dependent transcriptional regulator [Nitrososphaerota archaeon]|nr:metal-dependent transcriptional regulator [Nitrososphaerota archaeon]MDG6927481.1 metal-dependent transcriptional regulator [Nitrososphaerota archaeon]MDG6930867.1 metal-dependent transcriptional regulator [Nitrososphaerota archaeon]MDG6931542.1 metal-dependent transcriptional regulator [Nitrososphaerota archaeon]MDG6936024.1 metal-dependent transcriptional regulator [Nitrososphaerota archaeon]